MSASLIIVVDVREQELFNILSAMADEDKTPVMQEPLAVGDVQVRLSSPTAEGQETIMAIFERKTVADLAASRKDGRFAEQKGRMLAAIGGRSEAHRVAYIVEGTKGAGPFGCHGHGLSDDIYMSMIIHTMYRDGIHCIFTRDVSDTAGWVLQVAERCARHPEYFAAPTEGGEDGGLAGGGGGYLSSIKVKKADNLTPATVYLMQLAQVPGFSLKTAKAIAAQFPNWSSLLHALSNDLAAIRAIEGMGPKRVQTLRDFVMA